MPELVTPGRTILGPDGKSISTIGTPVAPKGVDAEEWHRRRNAAALGRVDLDEAAGTATTNCPYCTMFMRAKYPNGNPIDITKFIDQDGRKDHVVYCSENHRVVFKSTTQWREERQKLGLQVRG